jgi:hypothetical protein
VTEEITFDRFLDAVRGTNPFRSTRVTDPTRSDGDVGSIHQKAFDKLVRGVERVSKDPMPTGVLLLGTAGVGKSHMLARLFQWAEEDHATVVYLHNLLASPERMYRYVLSATVNSLASHQGAFAESRLYKVLTRALINEKDARALKTADARRTVMSQVVRKVDGRGTLGPVLAAFREAADPSSSQADSEQRAAAAVRWLAGETLDQEEAAWLGKKVPAEGASIPDDGGADEVLQVLAKLCALARLPLVLCLDQVDNLDPSNVTAVASIAHALIDRCQHLLVIVSGVKETLLRLKREGVIPEAAWDRIAEQTIELNRIGADEAEAIVKRRMEPMLDVFGVVPEVSRAVAADALFPIGTKWFQEKLGDVPEFRPRDIVMWARDRWEQQQTLLESEGGKKWLTGWKGSKPTKTDPTPLETLIDEEVKRKLAEGVNRRRLKPAEFPPDEDNLATLTHTLLARCVGDSRGTLVELTRPKPVKKVITHHLVAKERRSDGLMVSTGIAFVTATTGHGTHQPLLRLLEDKSPPDHRLVVTDEERRPLKLGKVGQEYSEKLNALGNRAFQHVKLTFEAYAELDSMVCLLNDARGNDLEIEYPKGVARTLTEEEALQSLHRNGRFLSHPLLRELLTEDLDPVVSGGDTDTGYNEERAKQHIMAELSWRLGLMARELAQTFTAKEKTAVDSMDSVWARIKETARNLHTQGHVHAHAQDDDLFLQYRKRPA